MSKNIVISRLLINAIENKQIIEFDYEGYHRIAEPHVYGILDGKHELLVYQIAGGSSSGGLPDWRRVKLKKISNFKIREQYFKGKRAFLSGKHSSFDRRLAIVN